MWSSICSPAGALGQLKVFSGRIPLPLNQNAFCLPIPQATSPHQSQQSTVDVGQLHDPQTYTQHAIQVQHIQVTEPTPSTPSSSQVRSPTVCRGSMVLATRERSCEWRDIIFKPRYLGYWNDFWAFIIGPAFASGFYIGIMGILALSDELLSRRSPEISYSRDSLGLCFLF